MADTPDEKNAAKTAETFNNTKCIPFFFGDKLYRELTPQGMDNAVEAFKTMMFNVYTGVKAGQNPYSEKVTNLALYLCEIEED